MKRVVLFFFMLSLALMAEWNFRGTPNSWASEAMTYNSSTGLYETVQTFANGDSSGGPRFKIDRYGDWTEAYPGADYVVTGNTTYKITINPSTTAITVTEEGQGPDAWYFRGTPNSWGTTAMTYNETTGLYELTVQFANGEGNPRFKIDHYADWTENYPTGDYTVTAYTEYKIEFNASSKAITATAQGTQPGDGINKLGADYSADKTIFSIWSPDSSNVKVLVNGTEYTLSPVAAVDTGSYSDINDGNIYSVTVNGDLNLAEYQFMINGVAVRDPYGVMVKPGTNTNIVIDMSLTEPDGGWAPVPAMVNREDAVVYEMHVRDFTISDTSGVTASNRGKYLGAVETGTTYNGLATGIDHLKELGITHIQLMPVYDFTYGQYNWGYDPQNYNVPEETYTSKDVNDYIGRIKEFKTMVNEFHKNGIRVVMDVVYNHTTGDEMFENITSRYYTGNNDSGCGNGVNTGEAFVSRMIRDSLEFWAGEYQMDGFRFDLVGIFHYAAYGDWGNYLNNQKFTNRNLLMYGEPWNGYWGDPEEYLKVRMGKMPAVAYAHVGVFNGKYRENVKGDNDSYGRGYMFNVLPSWTGAIAAGARGSITAVKSTAPLADNWDSMFAYDPEQSINYISAHDNYDLWDKIKHVGEDNAYGVRVDKFGMGMILTSQGIPFMHGGDEMLRTKVVNGDWTYAHNSYNAPDAYNMVRWNWKQDNYEVFEYYKDLIQLRKDHPGLRKTTWDEINAGVDTYTWDNGVVVSYIDEDGNASTKELIVVYNPGAEFQLADANGWTKVFDINGAYPLDQSNTCEGTAVTVFSIN